MAIAARLRHDVVIHRFTAGSEDEIDGRGNRTDTWVPAAAIPGLVQRRASREIRGADPDGVGVSDAKAFLPIGTGVDGHDYLEAEGSVYEVIGPARDAGGRGRHLELDLLLVVP